MKFSLVICALLALQLTALVSADEGAAPSRGKLVFDRWCTPCHGAGPGHPGTAGLAVKYGTSKPAELERRTDLTTDIVKTFVRHGFGAMAPFRKTEISDVELNDLANYLSSPKADPSTVR